MKRMLEFNIDDMNCAIIVGLSMLRKVLTVKRL